MSCRQIVLSCSVALGLFLVACTQDPTSDKAIRARFLSVQTEIENGRDLAPAKKQITEAGARAITIVLDAFFGDGSPSERFWWNFSGSRVNQVEKLLSNEAEIDWAAVTSDYVHHGYRPTMPADAERRVRNFASYYKFTHELLGALFDRYETDYVRSIDDRDAVRRTALFAGMKYGDRTRARHALAGICSSGAGATAGPDLDKVTRALSILGPIGNIESANAVLPLVQSANDLVRERALRALQSIVPAAAKDHADVKAIIARLFEAESRLPESQRGIIEATVGDYFGGVVDKSLKRFFAFSRQPVSPGGRFRLGRTIVLEIKDVNPDPFRADLYMSLPVANRALSLDRGELQSMVLLQEGEADAGWYSGGGRVVRGKTPTCIVHIVDLVNDKVRARRVFQGTAPASEVKRPEYQAGMAVYGDAPDPRRILAYIKGFLE